MCHEATRGDGGEIRYLTLEVSWCHAYYPKLVGLYEREREENERVLEIDGNSGKVGETVANEGQRTDCRRQDPMKMMCFVSINYSRMCLLRRMVKKKIRQSGKAVSVCWLVGWRGREMIVWMARHVRLFESVGVLWVGKRTSGCVSRSNVI